MGEHKKSHIFDILTGIFGYFPDIIVLFYVKMIRKFIQCKMQRGKELLLTEEGFEYICVFSG